MKVLSALTSALFTVALGAAEAQQSGVPPAGSTVITVISASEVARNFAQVLQSVTTAIALIAGGMWAYRKFILRQEKYPHIETSADINFIGKHKEHWVVELIAWAENKGTSQHKMSEFDFDIYHLRTDDTLHDDERFGGQVSFPHLTKAGSFLPDRYKFFFIDPGVKAKYSYITKVPPEAKMVIFHWSFKYADGRGYGHTAEITKPVPELDTKEHVQLRPDAS